MDAAEIQPMPVSDSSLSLSQHEATSKPIGKADVQTENLKRTLRRRRLISVLQQIGSIVYDILAALFIALVYGVPGCILVIIVFGLILGLTFGLNAAYAAIAMLIGNAILRAAHLAHYTDNGMAAAIGATGSPVAVLILSFPSQFIPKDEEGRPPWYISIFFQTGLMALSAVLGAAILRHNHIDLHGTDVLHATRAGALGGAILGPGTILATPIIFLALGLALSPLWIAMKFGFRWVYVRSSESWDDRGRYKSMHCYTYGTCGDDSDIEDELQQLPNHHLV